MKSVSSTSLGTRLGNAKKILSQLTTYPDYAPTSDDLSVAQLKAFMDSVEKLNAEAATKIQEYTNAVDIRQKAFRKDSNSLHKTAIQITALVRSSFGRGSKEAAAIQAMSVKIRGVNPGKKKPAKPGKTGDQAQPATTDTKAADTPSPSRIESTFGNMLKTFDDIVATLISYNGTYKASGAFSITALKTKSIALAEMNVKADVAHALLKQIRDDRTDVYIKLADRIRRTKDGIQGQYGPSSSEYKLLKGIKS